MVEDSAFQQSGLAIDAGEFPDSANSDAAAHSREGKRVLEERRLTDAADHFKAATQSDPSHAGAWHDLGIVLYRLERWEEAAEAFDTCLGLAPEAKDIAYKIGLCSLQNGQFQQAVDAFTEAASSGHLESRFQLGLICVRQAPSRRRARQQAVEHFEAILAAVELGEDYAGIDRVCFALGGLHSEDSETRDEAVQVYRRGLSLNPLSAVGHNSLGLLLMQSGQVLGALGEFKVAIQLDPAYRAPYTNLACLLFQHINPTELSQEYEHLIEEFDSSAPMVLARLTQELVEMGREQAYEGLYTKGHQLKNLMSLMGSRLRGLARKVRGQVEWEDELAGLGREQERFYEEWVGFLGAMKPEQVHPVVAEPVRLVRRVVEAVNTQADTSQITVRVQEGLPKIEADERMIREAVTNLTLNALDALGQKGGCIVIGVGYDDEQAVVFIEVEDDGPGIAPEQLDYIFDPGFTTKEKGNGYGLSIARRIVRAHHGELRVKSRVGHGTVFRLDLPVNFDTGGPEEYLGGSL